MKAKTYVVIFLSLISGDILADTWRYPEVTNYLSENGCFVLKIFPAKIPDNYYKWSTAKPKKKNKYTEKDTCIILCHAVLYEINGVDTTEIWNKRLINKIAPVTALVANDGKSIVTFDNWHSMGYGIDVMVTYNEFGELVKKYKLDDFSPFPINTRCQFLLFGGDVSLNTLIIGKLRFVFMIKMEMSKKGYII